MANCSRRRYITAIRIPAVCGARDVSKFPFKSLAAPPNNNNNNNNTRLIFSRASTRLQYSQVEAAVIDCRASFIVGGRRVSLTPRRHWPESRRVISETEHAGTGESTSDIKKYASGRQWRCAYDTGREQIILTGEAKNSC